MTENILPFLMENWPIILLHLVAGAVAWFTRVHLGALIWAVYKFVWYTVLQRREPFTHQLSRMVVCHGGFFWAVFVGVQFALYQHFQPPWWLSIDWLALNAWLIDHLIDYVRLHPENLPNR
ncbi:MAG: hypothetical protein P3T54_00255 [Dehalogenimonas sp.]|nr:hypothetical protein [Dehalogenimonas sp.]